MKVLELGELGSTVWGDEGGGEPVWKPRKSYKRKLWAAELWAADSVEVERVLE